MSLSRGDVTISDGYKATYVASWAAFTPTTAIMFSITAGTRVVKVLRVGFSSTQTTAGITTLILNRLTSITGGTTVAPTGIVPFDSNSPAATATPVTYTTAPTPSGTQPIRQMNVVTPLPAAVRAEQNEYIYDFTNPRNQIVTLITAGQALVLANGGQPTGFSVSLWVEWTEE